jgi:hypothetical protein
MMEETIKHASWDYSLSGFITRCFDFDHSHTQEL